MYTSTFNTFRFYVVFVPIKSTNISIRDLSKTFMYKATNI